MKSYLKELHKICTQSPITEKILIVDSHSIGEQILEGYSKAGYHAIHIKTKTVVEIATELVELHAPKPCKVMEQPVGTQLVFKLLKSLKEQNALQYFGDIEITPAFSQAIYQTVKVLRLSGYTKDSFPTQCFISPEKSEDLFVILSHYEELLATNHLVDEAELLTKAITYLQTMNKKIFILQANLTLSYLEEQLLEKLTANSFYKLPLAQVFGVAIPKTSSFQTISFSEPTPFSYLYDLHHASEIPIINLFIAKTIEVELKQVFAHLKAKESKLDTSVIFHTNTEAYVIPIYHLAERLNIPITYGEGLSISCSRPGRLVSGFIRWMKSQYSVQLFLEILNEGLLDLGEAAPSKTRIAKLLRNAQIGWSQSRYLTQLEIAIQEVSEKMDVAETDELKEYYAKKIGDLTWLKQWFSKLFKNLPEMKTELNYKELLQGISFILKKIGRSVSVLDQVAKTTILEEIEVILPYADESLHQYEAFQKLSDFLLAIRVMQSGPKPGALHVTSYKKGVYHNRQHVFIVGLDNRSFPGQAGEDPLLLDDERIKLGRALPLQKEQGKLNLYTMLQLLAETKGLVSLSYCSFDMNGNRTMSPAHLFLQAYRMKTGNQKATFHDVKQLVNPFIPSAIFEKKDFWSAKLSQHQFQQIDDELLQKSYQTVVHGLVSAEGRLADNFTPFDGNVQMDNNDATKLTERLSAGKLERLAKCPYSYFLQDILKVRPIDDFTYDSNTWLDAATRGSLLHKIFELFYNELQTANEKPLFSVHEDKIITIANELIDKQKQVLPPPNNRVFEQEVSDTLHCCKIFLKEEEVYCNSYEPVHLEYAFGMDGQAPALIKLPSGDEIQLSGVIDRVDRSESGHYHIIDYKTGSSYSYNEQNSFYGGRQLQHFLYALAIEQHLQLEPGSVFESSYYFPTSKGLGERYIRKQDDTLRTNGLAILEKLVAILKHGHFVLTDDKSDCKYCSYATICRRDFYEEEGLKNKYNDEQSVGVRKFKGVRAYD